MTKKFKLIVVSLVLLLGVFMSLLPQQAAAVNLTTITENGDYSVKACKRTKSSDYGPLWEVTVVVGRTNPDVNRSASSVLRNGNSVYESGIISSWFGDVQAYTVLSSKAYSETLRVNVQIIEPGNPQLILFIHNKLISVITVC